MKASNVNMNTLNSSINAAISGLAELSVLEDTQVSCLDFQGTLGDEQIAVTITHAVQAAECISKVLCAESCWTTLHRLFIWRICHLHLDIYNWYFETGPAVAEQLCRILLEKGEEALKGTNPLFYPLMMQIDRYLTRLIELKRDLPTRMDRRRGETQSLDSDLDEVRDPELDRLKILPARIYPFDGITLSISNSIALPNIHPAHVQPDQERKIKLMQQCFVDIIFNALLEGKIIQADKYFNNPHVRSFDLNHLRARFFSRAGFLFTVIKNFGWEDGIFFAGDWKGVLESPYQLFGASNCLTFSAKICRDRVMAFAPLDIWLRKNIQPEAISAAESLGDAVYALLKSFTMVSSSNSQPGPSHTQRKQKHIQGPAERSRQRKPQTAHTPLSIEALICSSEMPQYGAAGILLREGLKKKRGQPARNDLIHRILNGLRPALGRKSVQKTRNPDHYNPLRMSNEYSHLFLSSISPSHATSSLGISNILVFMSTGQGYSTADFIRQTDMKFVSLENCIGTYRRALERKEHCFDLQVWGQTSNQFGLCLAQGSKGAQLPTPVDKFAPFFQPHIQQKWQNFLGEGLMDKDPTTVEPNKKPSWESALEWIGEQHFMCFGSKGNPSLTAFQFCHNLVALQICRAPTVKSMGSFIAKHRRFGSFKALIDLGFDVNGRGHQFVEAAFACFHHHLESNLNHSDSSDMSLSPIVSEHLLCKVSRVNYLLKQQTHTSLSSEALKDRSVHDFSS